MSEEEKKVVEEEKPQSVMASTSHNPNDPVVCAKQLLDAGCHFGHRVSRWNPKMREYIYGKRNNLHIIDLDKTVVKLQEAYVALRDIVLKNGKVLFVGTKPYAQKSIEEEAKRSGSFYVNKRWLGGTLTNFRNIYKRIALLKEIEMNEQTGVYDVLPKKEVIEKMKLKAKLSANLEGIKEIRTIPQAIVIIDPKAEHNAIREARSLKVPIFALGDTNTDPDEIDYLIPCNDDGEDAIRIVVGLLADAVVEGKGGEPFYAYKGVTKENGMNEILRTVDSAEQLKSIKAKLRNDALASKKSSSKGGNPKRGKYKKDNRYYEEKNEGEFLGEQKAEVSEDQEAPAEEAETQSEE